MSLPMRLLEMRSVGEFDERRGEIGPRFAAVGAADDSAFERRIDDIGLDRIGDDARHPRWESHFAVPGRLRTKQLRPVVAAVLAAIDADRRHARAYNLRPRGMKCERPYYRTAIGKPQPFPVPAAVGGAIGTVLRARI